MTIGIFEENWDLYGPGAAGINRALESEWAFWDDAVVINGNNSFFIDSDNVAFDTTVRTWCQVIGARHLSRAVFPTGATTQIGFWTRFFTEQLPSSSAFQVFSQLRTATNGVVFELRCNATGQIEVHSSSGTIVATTVLPVLSASTIHTIQCEVDLVSGDVEIRVDGNATAVLQETGLSFSTSGAAQYGFERPVGTGSAFLFPFYIESIAVYDLDNGGVGQFPNIAGVQTVFINEETPQAGFSAVTQTMTGVGSLDLTTGDSGIFVESGDFALTDQDYTLELDVRFTDVPAINDYFHIAGRWDDNATDIARSYQLRFNGTGINEGGLQFRISTDGTPAGVIDIHDVTFTPILGRMYHFAVVREAGMSRFFIDGVQQGLPVPDTNVYASAPDEDRYHIGREGGSDPANFRGFMDEVRLTRGVARYSANFIPTRPHGRNSTEDPDFANVLFLAGFEIPFAVNTNSTNIDEGPGGETTFATGNAAAIFPDDADFTFQVADATPPIDNSYLEATLVPAFAILNLAANPLDTETVTIAGQTYTFVAALTGADDVLIGVDLFETLENLEAAINGGDGDGTVYGTGTAPNASVSGEAGNPTAASFRVQALVSGNAGNALTVSETLTDGEWTTANLVGGTDLPPPSTFGIQNLPPTATGVRWLSVRHRSAIDLGDATIGTTFNVSGFSSPVAEANLTDAFIWHIDRIQNDPSTGGALTPNSIVNGSITINRTE